MDHGRADLTVRNLLDAPLREPRVRSLEEVCGQLADRPLPGTLAEMRQVLGRPVTPEARRRLHVLVSALYHHAGAPLDLTEQLRAQIQDAGRAR